MAYVALGTIGGVLPSCSSAPPAAHIFGYAQCYVGQPPGLPR